MLLNRIVSKFNFHCFRIEQMGSSANHPNPGLSAPVPKHHVPFTVPPQVSPGTYFSRSSFCWDSVLKCTVFAPPCTAPLDILIGCVPPMCSGLASLIGRRLAASEDTRFLGYSAGRQRRREGCGLLRAGTRVWREGGRAPGFSPGAPWPASTRASTSTP